MNLASLLIKYRLSKLKFADRTFGEYSGSIVQLERWANRDLEVEELTDDLLSRFLRARFRSGSSPQTVRKDRTQLLTLWRWAYRKGLTQVQPRDVADVPTSKRKPKAFSSGEFQDILRRCHLAPRRPGWDARHWQALLLTAYDSAERIGALLRCPRTGFEAERRVLRIPGAVRKRDQDHVASLHDDTVRALLRILDTPAARSRHRLFPWRFTAKTLRLDFRVMLRRAGMEAEPNGLFHKLRRTSYTLCYAALGPQAATKHAGHSQDLSKAYLDESLLTQTRVADALPRPTVD